MTDIFLFISYFTLSCSGLVLMKYGSMAKDVLFKIPVVDMSVSIYWFLGLACYGVSFLLNTVLVSRHDLSFLNPFTVGVTSVLIFASSVLFFHETVTIGKVVGILVIVLGVVILNVSK